MGFLDNFFGEKKGKPARKPDAMFSISYVDPDSKFSFDTLVIKHLDCHGGEIKIRYVEGGIYQFRCERCKFGFQTFIWDGLTQAMIDVAVEKKSFFYDFGLLSNLRVVFLPEGDIKKTEKTGEEIRGDAEKSIDEAPDEIAAKKKETDNRLPGRRRSQIQQEREKTSAETAS